MSFTTTQHSGMPYVDKPYKTMLVKLAKKHKRNIKSELEYIVWQATEQAGLVEEDAKKVLTK